MSVRSSSWLWVALLVMAGAACGEIAGLDTFIRGQGQGGGGGSSTSSSGATGGGGQTSSGLFGGGGSTSSDCPDGKVEAPEVPSGWEGHVMILDSPSEAGLPACDGSAPVTLHAGLSASPATCGCSCGTPWPIQCTATLTRYPDGVTCVGTVQGTKVVASQVCTSLGFATALPTKFVPDPVSTGFCAATALPPSIDEASWDTHLRVCEATVGDIDDQGCADAPPAPFDARLCIRRAGSHDCPVDFPIGQALYERIDDTRGCEDDCLCGPGSVVCGGVLRLYGNAPPCTTPTPPDYGTDACIVWTGPGDGAFYDATVSGTCAPGAATSAGDAVGADSQTVCCAH